MEDQKDKIIERCRDYKVHLKKATRFLMGNHDIILSCNDMMALCNKIYSQLMSVQNYWSIGLDPAWVIPINNREICGCPGDVSLVITGHINLLDKLQIQQSISASILLIPEKKYSEDNQYCGGPLNAGESVIVSQHLKT